MTRAKPFDIPKREVWEAFKKVKANRGPAGVDGQSTADCDEAPNALLGTKPLNRRHTTGLKLRSRLYQSR
jgi:hypothetical protein